MNKIEALNDIVTGLGGTGGYKYEIQALNAWAVLVGAAGGYKYEIQALNAIDKAKGGTGLHKYNIDALNSICKAAGGSGLNKYEIAALAFIGALLNQIPAKELATLWLDGTILEDEGDYYFVDKIAGNNVLINDYDFPDGWVKGFPYKSAATIDIFGQTGVPVVSLFQNFNYADQYFCKHVAQVVDIEGYSILDAYVYDIVAYSEALTGGDLSDANAYFSVPAPINDFYIAQTGNDITGDGTFANPYQTFVKAYNSVPAAKNTYIKNIDTQEYLYSINKDSAYIGIGLSKYKGLVGEQYGMRIVGAAFRTLKNLDLSFLDATNLGIYFQTANNAIVDRCRIVSASIATISGVFLKINNTIIKDERASTYLIQQTGDVNWSINNCLLNKINGQGFLYIYDTAGPGIISNNIFKGSSVRSIIVLSSNTLTLVGNQFNNICTHRLLQISGDRGNLKIIKNTITQGDTVQEMIYCSGYTVNLVTIDRNTINSSNKTMSLILLSNSNGLVSKNIIKHTENNNAYADIFSSILENTFIVDNNKILSQRTGGYNIGVGTETINANENSSININIVNNYIHGNNNSTHSIFIGFQINAKIMYNTVKKGGYGTVCKGSTNTVYTENGINYNLFIDCTRNIYLKGANGVVVSNNTIIVKSVLSFYALSIGINIGGDQPDNSSFKNNIIVNTSENSLTAIILEDNLKNNYIDYNIYYSPSGLNFVVGTDTLSFSQWQALGYDANSIVLTEEQFNALFTDFANDDYSLATGSVAIGAGFALDAAYDEGLDASTVWGSDTDLPVIVTKQQAAAWDCGAYVH